ncbi:hypothetical protein QCA50_018304 [Cerrena zonata]|uniref:Uncharacterized protein n=1 Tax=Cerrena zonata TaxID=2478898 RepID=A0AAW0FHC0_9APHY
MSICNLSPTREVDAHTGYRCRDSNTRKTKTIIDDGENKETSNPKRDYTYSSFPFIVRTPVSSLPLPRGRSVFSFRVKFMLIWGGLTLPPSVVRKPQVVFKLNTNHAPSSSWYCQLYYRHHASASFVTPISQGQLVGPGKLSSGGMPSQGDGDYYPAYGTMIFSQCFGLHV